MKKNSRKYISKTIGISIASVVLGVGLWANSALANSFVLQDAEKTPTPAIEGEKKKEKDPNKKAKLNKLFRDKAPLTVSLHLPLKNIRSRRMGEMGELPAKLILNDEEGNPQTFDIKVELRGITRQSKDTCTFPPIKLNFKRGAVKKTVFAKQNKLKLVTYCNKSGRFQPLYMKEYLIYQIYNMLTDYSFQTRLLDITYLDEKGGGKAIQRVGFVIEDVDDVAARNAMVAVDIDKVPSKSLDAKTANLDGIFQFFIGNLDWSMRSAALGKDCCHNGKLLQNADGSGAYYPVPYDFDYAGLVNAPYAVPPDGMGVRKVTQRHYRGYCSHDSFNAENLALFKEKREEISQLITGFDLLPERDRRKTMAFVDKFYDILNDPKKLNKQIINKCVGRR